MGGYAYYQFSKTKKIAEKIHHSIDTDENVEDVLEDPMFLLGLKEAKRPILTLKCKDSDLSIRPATNEMESGFKTDAYYYQPEELYKLFADHKDRVSECSKFCTIVTQGFSKSSFCFSFNEKLQVTEIDKVKSWD